jgi:hypothetical protein
MTEINLFLEVIVEFFVALTNSIKNLDTKKKIVIKLVNDPKVQSTVYPSQTYSFEEWCKVVNASLLHGRSTNHIDCDV